MQRPIAAWLLFVMLLALALPAAAAEPARTGSGVHYVYLIRHGDYDRGPDRDADDVVENGLNALGREQARLIGARLAALPVKPASFVSSTYRRARETAEEIGAIIGMKPTLDSLIHECTGTVDRADLMKNLSAEEIAWCDSNLARAWRKYMVATPAADRHDVLVCHGNVIRWFVSRAVSGDPRHWSTMDIGNASLTILAVRADGTIKLVCFSDVGHLPVAKQSWTGRGAGWGQAKK